MKRGPKQILYGLFYVLITGLICYSAYYFYSNQKSGCSDCLPGDLKIEAGEPLTLSLNESNSIILVPIKNPSAKYGLAKFDYTLTIFSAFGPQLAKISGSSSLYPGESKYVFQSRINLRSDDIGKIDFQTGQLDWTLSLPPKVDIKISGLTTVSELNFKVEEGTASSLSAVSGVSLLGIGFDQDNKIIGASSVELSAPVSISAQEFRIYLPDLDYKNIEVFSEIAPR